MPRLTPITKREQVSGDALTAFDAIIEFRGSINLLGDLVTPIACPLLIRKMEA